MKTIIGIKIKTKTKNVKRSLYLAGWELREGDLLKGLEEAGLGPVMIKS